MLSRIRIFSIQIPDPKFFHPGSRIGIKEFKYFKPKRLFLSSRKYDPGCSSRIRIPIFFYSSRILDPGVKKALDSGSATLGIVLFTNLLVLTVLWWAGVAWLRPCWLLQVGGHQLTVQRWLDFQLLATATNLNYLYLCKNDACMYGQVEGFNPNRIGTDLVFWIKALRNEDPGIHSKKALNPKNSFHEICSGPKA
jgi:hypothetical protein